MNTTVSENCCCSAVNVSELGVKGTTQLGRGRNYCRGSLVGSSHYSNSSRLIVTGDTVHKSPYMVTILIDCLPVILFLIVNQRLDLALVIDPSNVQVLGVLAVC